MVAVAQLVESRIVIPVVVGSSPISHPKILKQNRRFGACFVLRAKFGAITSLQPPSLPRRSAHDQSIRIARAARRSFDTVPKRRWSSFTRATRQPPVRWRVGATKRRPRFAARIARIWRNRPEAWRQQPMLNMRALGNVVTSSCPQFCRLVRSRRPGTRRDIFCRRAPRTNQKTATRQRARAMRAARRGPRQMNYGPHARCV